MLQRLALGLYPFSLWEKVGMRAQEESRTLTLALSRYAGEGTKSETLQS